MDLDRPEGNSNVRAERRMEMATLVEMMGMTSLRGLFRQRKKLLYKFWTWFQKRGDAIH